MNFDRIKQEVEDDMDVQMTDTILKKDITKNSEAFIVQSIVKQQNLDRNTILKQKLQDEDISKNLTVFLKEQEALKEKYKNTFCVDSNQVAFQN